MFKKTILAAIAMAAAAQAQGSEDLGRTIECGDHWYNVTVTVGLPDSVIFQGGDSRPTPDSVPATTEITDGGKENKASTTYTFTSVGLAPAIKFAFTTTDGTTGTGLWTEGDSTPVELNDCSISAE